RTVRVKGRPVAAPCPCTPTSKRPWRCCRGCSTSGDILLAYVHTLLFSHRENLGFVPVLSTLRIRPAGDTPRIVSGPPRHRAGTSDLAAACGGRSTTWEARVSACRFPGRPHTRPAGATTGRWDVPRYGTGARLATGVASRAASLPTSPAARRPSGRAT